MAIVGRLDEFGSMLAWEFDDYSMSENLFPWSETFTVGNGWGGGGTITLDSSIVDPNGNTGTVYYPTVSEWTREFNGLGATTITLSFFTKVRSGGSGNTTYIQMYQETAIGEPSNVGAYNFDMVGSNPDSGRFTNITRTPYPNGWYRFTCKVISNAVAGSGTFTSTSRVDLEGGQTTNYVWGIQVERGSVATDYTPTRGTAINRILPATTNTNITGLGTYYSSGFDENVGFTTLLPTNIFMRQKLDKTVIVYNEIDEVTDFYGRGIVRNGLLLDLDAGISSSYPGSGSTWTDLSTNSTAVNLSSTSYTTDAGGGISFSSSASSANFTATLNFSGGFTLETWIKHTGVVSTARVQRYMTIGSSPLEGPVLRHNSASNGSLHGYLFDSGNTFREIDVAGQILTNTYYHLVYTYDGTTFRLYKNNVQVGTLVATVTLPTLGTTHGLAPGGVEYFEGNMYAARYYNRALTAAEILQNYDALRNRFGL